jgi:hypothetical protein
MATTKPFSPDILKGSNSVRVKLQGVGSRINNGMHEGIFTLSKDDTLKFKKLKKDKAGEQTASTMRGDLSYKGKSLNAHGAI